MYELNSNAVLLSVYTNYHCIQVKLLYSLSLLLS